MRRLLFSLRTQSFFLSSSALIGYFVSTISRANSQDTVLQDVSCRIGDALRAHLERSSISSGGSQATEELYVPVAEVPVGRHTTSRGTLASSRLWTIRFATAQGAAGLIGGVWVKFIDSRANEAVCATCR